MSDINKDIEIVEKFIEETQEEYSETLVDGKVYRIENIPLEFKPTKELANSISNVLSDRETWKNIAEKLASILIYLPLGKDQKQFFTKEAVIDWAKREENK